MIDFSGMAQTDNTVMNSEPAPLTYFPPESLEITLSTGGRLSSPRTLHVTDYTMEDVLKLSTSNPETLLNELMQVIQNCIKDPEVSVEDLHENEFEEVAFTLYYTNWSHVINDYPYPWTREEVDQLEADGVIDAKRKYNLLNGKEVPRINLSLDSVQLVPLQEDFSEPIAIRIPDGSRIGFRLPRIGDFRILTEALKAKYHHEDMEFLDTKRRVQRDQTKAELEISPHRMEEYRDYERRRAIDMIQLRQGLLVQWIENKDGERQSEFTNNERIQFYHAFDRKVWITLNKALEDLKFGIDHEVMVRSPFTGENVTRRCSFQIMDFIPTNDVPDDSGYTVSFGT
jgi:hypothetical protein